ncbi:MULTISPECIES: hypothetical protein [unclassified Burkholderia]|uniref:DUF7024 domain-containing protein n=1 Tax=unclassified Burkholderia TaxID=2613784 RepID=UPI00075E6E44|nr:MULTISPECIES: hypothetical protein [unclassified Burkholderia]KUY94671.1 sugar translocase [Burkholderia sp. RF7-non_BP1]KUZ02048.1 sugar translocase [Burkholderia sp. RF7-non_BP4]
MNDRPPGRISHMQSSENRLASEWTFSGTLMMVCLVVGWQLSGAAYLGLHLPLIYGSDGIFTLSLIQRAVRSHWFFSTELLGAPFGASLYDYPIPDSGSMLVLKVLGRTFGNPATALDLYYLIGFPLNAVAAYWVLRKLRISKVLSFAGGFIFTLLPFHFLRLHHLFYTWYFAAPMFVWFAKRIWDGEMSFSFERRAVKRTLLDALILLVLSCFGVYYAFFGVLCLLTAGIVRSVQQKAIKAIWPAIVAVTIVSFGIVANVSPNLIYRMQHGVNQEAAWRSPGEAELYGLKIDQLLLPRPDHRYKPFAKLTADYSTTFPLVNENAFASLGIIGSVGLLSLVIFVVVPTQRRIPEEPLQLLASLTIVLVLFCTIGGFSGIFSLLVSPMIRAWNRVSVFVAFMSIAAVLLLIQRYLCAGERASLRIATFTLALCAFALWDQTTSPSLTRLEKNKVEFNSDASFARAIEQQVPAGSAIYQLPYVGFPEGPTLNRLEPYDLARPFLHTSALRWSFGGMKGRDGDLFFRYLALEPVARQIEVIRRIGFNGIYIDRRGYADNGAAIEAELTRNLGVAPTVSRTGDQVFFALASRSAGTTNVDLSGMTAHQIMERAGYVVDKLGPRNNNSLSEGIDLTQTSFPRFLENVRGLSMREDWGRWSDASVFPGVELTFVQPLPARFTLHVRMQGYGPNIGKPSSIVIGQQTETVIPGAEIREFALRFDNPTAARAIWIQPALPRSPQQSGTGNDGRLLGVGIQKIWITTGDAPALESESRRYPAGA